MTSSRATRLKRALEFKATNEGVPFESLVNTGGEREGRRLRPIHAALVECVEALKKYENIIASHSFDKTDWAAKDALEALDAVLVLNEKVSEG